MSETEHWELLEYVHTEVEARERIVLVDASGCGVRDHRQGMFHNTSPTAYTLSSYATNMKGTFFLRFFSARDTGMSL